MDYNKMYSEDRYLIRQKFWKVFGKTFHIYGKEKEPIFEVKKKAFKFKEDIRFYPNNVDDLLIKVKAETIFDAWGRYKIEDPKKGKFLAKAKRKALKSMLKDSWEFYDKEDGLIAKLEESSNMGAFMARGVDYMPQHYNFVDNDGKVFAELAQMMNPFILKYDLRIHDDSALDVKSILAGSVLIASVEGRQKTASNDN